MGWTHDKLVLIVVSLMTPLTVLGLVLCWSPRHYSLSGLTQTGVSVTVVETLRE